MNLIICLKKWRRARILKTVYGKHLFFFFWFFKNFKNFGSECSDQLSTFFVTSIVTSWHVARLNLLGPQVYLRRCLHQIDENWKTDVVLQQSSHNRILEKISIRIYHLKISLVIHSFLIKIFKTAERTVTTLRLREHCIKSRKRIFEFHLTWNTFSEVNSERNRPRSFFFIIMHFFINKVRHLHFEIFDLHFVNLRSLTVTFGWVTLFRVRVRHIQICWTHSLYWVHNTCLLTTCFF